MTNQKLFEALQRVCGFTALESDMFEIIKAVEADKMPSTEDHKYSIGYSQAAKKEERIFNAEMTKSLRTMTETIEQAAERHAELQEATYTPQHKVTYTHGFKDGAEYQLSQPNTHRITQAHIYELDDLYYKNKITHSRMVEILNEIAAGSTKKRLNFNTSDMKKTALNWLIEMLDIDTNDSITKDVIKQAIEMERQQIIDAWIDGEGYDCIAASPQAEQYYTQTFTPKND